MFFTNGKRTFVNGPKTSPRNLHFWFIAFSVVSFNKIAQFSKNWITFIICSISLFVSVSPVPIADEMFLLGKFHSASKRTLEYLYLI